MAVLFIQMFHSTVGIPQSSHNTGGSYPEVRSSGTLECTSRYPSARPELQNSIRYCSNALSERFYDLQNPRDFVVREWV